MDPLLCVFFLGPVSNPPPKLNDDYLFLLSKHAKLERLSCQHIDCSLRFLLGSCYYLMLLARKTFQFLIKISSSVLQHNEVELVFTLDDFR